MYEKDLAAVNVPETQGIHEVMVRSRQAFESYKKCGGLQRAAFLEQIAVQIEARKESLVQTAKAETNLPEPRLNGEVARTTGQLRMFANLLKEGSWVEASIDTADPQRQLPKPDIRKMLVATGPVVVFGASNFPLAFSTAGGDTASALAAGCAVVVRAHFGHPKTSQLVFEAIGEAIAISGMPAHTVQHVATPGNETGKELVIHPFTKGVGFTGSFNGGKALMDYAATREEPIPVFAEMSSVNPVVLYPGALAQKWKEWAGTYASSITLGVGQFCTNPGLLFGIKSEAFNLFRQQLGEEISKIAPATMLHEGIAAHYTEKLQQQLLNNQLSIVGESVTAACNGQAKALVASVSGADFIQTPGLAEEIFGPYSLIVECENKEELKQALLTLGGQLTTTLMAEEEDAAVYGDVVELQSNLAGRIIWNNVPTGVEVCASMVHGGPYPATSDQRFTSVGTGAIRRWVKPVAFQNFPDGLLPKELKNVNELQILRLVNNDYTRADI